MADQIHIGTSGWNYDHWRGRFYPEDLAKKEWLHYYSRHLHTVEINNTFYQLPKQDTFHHWKNTPANPFRFAVKASRYITHMKKLKDPEKGVSNFLKNAGYLGNKLGPILFQLPPNWKCNLERLTAFLEFLPKKYRYTFEFRDHRWINDRTVHMLEKNNVAFCIYELAGYSSPREVTADFVYMRLHGPGDKYQGRYDRASLENWAQQFHEWVQGGKEVFCYFDNDQEGFAVINAIELSEMVDS